MNKATIFDFARMCNNFSFNCSECPLHLSGRGMCLGCGEFIIDLTDKANEIILNWCKEHPVETRQDRFLKMFPNALRFDNLNIIAIKPCTVDKNYGSKPCTFTCEECEECIKNYWLAEVEENE